MREKTRQRLQAYYENGSLLGTDGKLHPMDGVTKIPMELCDCLADLHRSIKPDQSIETGLAYGFSTLAILDAMHELGYGHHTAIDCSQAEYWHGVALVAIDELGWSDRFTFMDSRTDDAMIQLIAERKRVQFAFLDGPHLFEAVLTDIGLVDRFLDVGGLLIVNNMWLPVIRAVASFLETNFAHYQTVRGAHENIFVARKTGEDARAWNHFAPFEGAGGETSKPAGLRKLFGR